MSKLKTLIIFLFLQTSLFAQVSDIQKAEVMFIYNFARLIQWPDNYREGDFTIAVIGSSDMLSELKNYTKQKKVGFQAVEVKRFKTPEQISKCHILFVSNSKSNLLPTIKEKLSGQSTLLISEKKGSIENGAAINFLVSGNKLKFELKESNATDHGLKLSARLKDMAAKVL